MQEGISDLQWSRLRGSLQLAQALLGWGTAGCQASGCRVQNSGEFSWKAAERCCADVQLLGWLAGARAFQDATVRDHLKRGVSHKVGVRL